MKQSRLMGKIKTLSKINGELRSSKNQYYEELNKTLRL
jgi:hypothetical protein